MLTTQDKRTIYNALKQEIPFGVIPLSSFFLVMRDLNFNHKNYGYTKGKMLVADCTEFLELLTEDRPSTAPDIRFFEWPEEGAQAAPTRMIILTDGRHVPVEITAPIVPESTPTESCEGTAPAVEAEPAPAAETPIAQQSAPAAPADADEALLPGLPLSRYCGLGDKTVQMLSDKTGLGIDGLRAVIDADYETALNAGKVQILSMKEGERKFSFPFSTRGLNGAEINLQMKESNRSGLRWYFQYIDERGTAGIVPPGKLLENFAYLGNWNDFLRRLANLALEECWDFSGEEGSYSILRSYIQYTFARLTTEDKICISADGQMASFNTGLVTSRYDDIYACFEPNLGSHQNRWHFTDFCVAARRGLGKQLVNVFNPLPQAATYFARKEDLLFDLDKELHCDYEHMIVENIHRFPLEFLEDETHGFADAQELIQGLKTASGTAKADLYEELRDVIAEESRLYNRLRNRVSDAIELACKMVRWNFKTALPSYYPTANSMSIMLPLYLRNDTEVDNVLVVELTQSGNYQGQTILTPEMAYVDARLVCRPNSEWLIPGRILQDESL